MIAINKRNLTPEQMDALLKKFGGNVDASDLTGAVESGKMDDFVAKNLNAAQSEKLSRLLNDKEATNQILNTPQAQKLMKMLFGEK